MGKSRYVMIGGFLGAGKTSAMIRLANYVASKGLRPGLVTNDQSVDLVDTARVRAAGFPVQEITGSCFCCNFNGLVEMSELLTSEHNPDVLIVEPVGSCTDLRATIGNPLHKFYDHYYDIAPLSVLVDPVRLGQFFGLVTIHCFSDKVSYIYGKQLEEAEMLVINKVDLLDQSQRRLLRESIQERFPKAKIHEISCVTNEGLKSWFDDILTGQFGHRSTMEVDYDTYAEGEALLGWLNTSARITASETFNGTTFLCVLARQIRGRLAGLGIEIAHLKMTLASNNSSEIGVVCLTRTDANVQITKTLDSVSTDSELRLNLRAEADPEVLKGQVVQTLKSLTRPSILCGEIHAFRPGRPNPTYRMAYTS